VGVVPAVRAGLGRSGGGDGGRRPVDADGEARRGLVARAVGGSAGDVVGTFRRHHHRWRTGLHLRKAVRAGERDGHVAVVPAARVRRGSGGRGDRGRCPVDADGEAGGGLVARLVGGGAGDVVGRFGGDHRGR